jgi:tRNA threonylcarbamoyladenosine biosynthesis protein TsaE
LEIVCKSLNELNGITSAILKMFPDEKIFAVSGELGAGKTTMIKAFCRALGADDSAKSPSFAIINEYEAGNLRSEVRGQKKNNLTGNKKQETGNFKIYHFDFYRIKDEEEAFDIGYEEYFYSGNYCFIEWPGKIPNLLPGEYVRIVIEVNEDESRLIKCSLVH